MKTEGMRDAILHPRLIWRKKMRHIPVRKREGALISLRKPCNPLISTKKYLFNSSINFKHSLYIIVFIFGDLFFKI